MSKKQNQDPVRSRLLAVEAQRKTELRQEINHLTGKLAQGLKVGLIAGGVLLLAYGIVTTMSKHKQIKQIKPKRAFWQGKKPSKVVHGIFKTTLRRIVQMTFFSFLMAIKRSLQRAQLRKKKI